MNLKLEFLNGPKFRARIKEFLDTPEVWKSLDINYHPPRVHRLYLDYMGLRINLHKIYPCTSEQALLHPHPWESIMEVLPGSKYEMGIGYGEGNDPKNIKIACKMVSNTGFQYEMLEKNGWHYVRPVDGCTYTLMITNKPWDRKAPKSTEPLTDLEEDYKLEIINYFKQHFK